MVDVSSVVTVVVCVDSARRSTSGAALVNAGLCASITDASMRTLSNGQAICVHACDYSQRTATTLDDLGISETCSTMSLEGSVIEQPVEEWGMSRWGDLEEMDMANAKLEGAVLGAAAYMINDTTPSYVHHLCTPWRQEYYCCVTQRSSTTRHAPPLVVAPPLLHGSIRVSSPP